MSGYDVKFWKHGENVTAGEFCKYVKENIPSDAIINVCGDSQIYLHYSPDGKEFSLDNCALSDLPEYEDCKAGELEIKEIIENGNMGVSIGGGSMGYVPLLEKAWERYRLDWMISHGCTVSGLIKRLQNQWNEYEADDVAKTKTSIMDIFSDWEADIGFEQGAIWACKEEFEENEFRDKEYMRHLLNDEEYAEWMKVNEPEPTAG